MSELSSERESTDVRWRAVLGRPVPALRSLVSTYGEYRESAPHPVLRREVPTPETPLIIELGDGLLVQAAEDAAGPRRATALVAVPGRGPSLTRNEGRQHSVQIRLAPLGAYRLLGPLHESAGRLRHLDEVWGSAGRDLVDRLAAAQSPQRRFALLDRLLAEIAAEGPEPDPEVVHAFERLRRTQGRVPISELVVETGWSRGRLAQRFRSQLGQTPKAVAALLRFDRAVRLISARPPAALASIAATCGYYDQAHLNRDFVAFAGCSPTAWRDAQLPGLPGMGSMPARR
ncbi:helix-turn-helix domain-containing protein [Actinoalloteichus hymeniacidonis]|uniref:DNA-binding domain-containing protein, AraC-type n=1 Tax=Actinoalloteichus hymeniacidonis TaxID=340345 RepID=A0AAC9HT91_9PSEU|nr:helix-turn-helix domain-containing protein [Actinoalloteichus hymeniacidonis]AOS65058.1 DNA-binding domain-containing protein, AraC-type [Actinoalloteichus hymeniacidonis]MBB5906863.1 AraC-like DNA-binding protein [Actinoalloteichus hymeniacidonis]